MMDNNISIGNAGEFFVAAELERRGLSASVLMKNTKDFDILSINRETNKQYAIQVKTTTKNGWILSEKNENIMEDNIFYVFVKIKDLEQPEYHIVPSEVVSKKLRESHQEWLSVLGRNGQPHNDNSIRTFEDRDNIYLNQWDYLK